MSDIVRVITTCTSRKLQNRATPGVVALPGLPEAEDAVPAERLYTGEQHRRLMGGVRTLRFTRPVDVWVISARAGLIPGEYALAPYDESFAGMATDELRARADRLGIADHVRRLVETPSAFTLLLAGNDYFDAARLEQAIDWAGPTVALASPSRTARLRRHTRLRAVAVSQAHAKQWSLPLTLLKGEIARRLLSGLASGALSPAQLLADDAVLDVMHRLEPQRAAC